jgi:hypothetical protein
MKPGDLVWNPECVNLTLDVVPGGLLFERPARTGVLRVAQTALVLATHQVAARPLLWLEALVLTDRGELGWCSTFHLKPIGEKADP